MLISIYFNDSLNTAVINGCNLFCCICPCSIVVVRPIISKYINNNIISKREGIYIIKLIDIWSITYNTVAVIINSGYFGIFKLSPGLSSVAMVHSMGVMYYIIWIRVRNKGLIVK